MVNWSVLGFFPGPVLCLPNRIPINPWRAPGFGSHFQALDPLLPLDPQGRSASIPGEGPFKG